jgi:hypothetical protein
MPPERIRDIIDLYWSDAWPEYYKSDWEPATINGTDDSEYCKTHFYYLWVYYDIDNSQSTVAFIPEFISGFPCKNWLKLGLVNVILNLTDTSEDDAYQLFAKNYKELHDICAWEEYKREFPDGDFSHDL